MTAKQSLINRIIFILSLLGVIMAIYVLQSFLRQSSIICLTGSGCEMVRKNPISWPFGIPVPAFGLVGYTGLVILSFLKSTLNPSQPITNNQQLITKIMLGIAIFGICFVTWFTSMELFVIKGICMWCAISAVNMYVIFDLLIFTLKQNSNQSSSMKDEG
jgi:uncharacterized membrane protein